MEGVELHLGDCLDVFRNLKDSSIDSIVTDPPYGISFMGAKWDYDVPSCEIWTECLRVLKPGGYLLAFSGTRTQHRMAVRIEDSGFEIRDIIAWVYGCGMPKSMDVGKSISKDAPNEWNGWGSTLKPALEPITMARKPLNGSLRGNVLEHGTGALNVDGCRVPTSDSLSGGSAYGSFSTPSAAWDRPWRHDESAMCDRMELAKQKITKAEDLGRFPANLIHDGSDDVLSVFPETAPSKKGSNDELSKHLGVVGFTKKTPKRGVSHDDFGGSAARFFYCAKATKADREDGLFVPAGGERANIHPTVKPTDLMRYLCRLVTPPNGVVLDVFMGSGSTGKAALLEGFKFVGIERDPIYFDIAKNRIQSVPPKLPKEWLENT